MTSEKTIDDIMCEAAYELHPNDSGAISWSNAARVARRYAEQITRERDLWVQVFERAVASTDHQETLDKLRAIHAHIASDAALTARAQPASSAEPAAERSQQGRGENGETDG